MLETVHGVFRDGRVELPEIPERVENTRVLVTFLREPAHEVRANGDGTQAPVRIDPETGASIPVPPGPERDAAIRELLDLMHRGFDSGGGSFATREEIYDERLDELERRRSGHR